MSHITQSESSTPPVNGTKSQWRQWAKAQRLQIQAEMPQISAEIIKHLGLSTLIHQAQTILLYYPLPHELDLTGLAKHPLLSDKQWALPRVVEGPEPQLACYWWQEGEALEKHPAFGMLEPRADAQRVQAPSELDLVIVPALAVDKQGVRLGYGKGYYDRFCAQNQLQHKTLCPVLDALFVEALPSELWDVPVQHIVTQSGLKVLAP